jgi:hypothetical protein
VKVRVEDREALGALRPLDVAAYLRSRGWSEVDPSDDVPLSAWETTSGAEKVEVLVPRHQEWRDYARRVREALETLGEIEQRSELAIMRDITAVFMDVVRLRATNGAASDDTIALLDGLGIGAAGRGLMLSAACSAADPKRAYSSRKPAQATRYVEGLRLGQSERGSYVLTLLSPVAPALTSSQLGLFSHPDGAPEPRDPYERQVTRTLGVALDKLHRAAARGAATGQLDAFEDAVPFGVSADLCEALDLVRECGHVSSFELSIGWAPSRPEPARTPSRAILTPDVLEVVHEAGRVLRERTPIEDFELEGPVIRLDRPEASLQGTAVVFGRVDGQPRQISVELWTPTGGRPSKRSPGGSSSGVPGSSAGAGSSSCS